MKTRRVDGFFEVGSHVPQIVPRNLRLDRRVPRLRGTLGPVDVMRWAVTVDRTPVNRLFSSVPDAWTAGVTEADRLDHLVAPVAQA
jgi:hypothetical protein